MKRNRKHYIDLGIRVLCIPAALVVYALYGFQGFKSFTNHVDDSLRDMERKIIVEDHGHYGVIKGG